MSQVSILGEPFEPPDALWEASVARALTTDPAEVAHLDPLVPRAVDASASGWESAEDGTETWTEEPSDDAAADDVIWEPTAPWLEDDEP